MPYKPALNPKRTLPIDSDATALLLVHAVLDPLAASLSLVGPTCIITNDAPSKGSRARVYALLLSADGRLLRVRPWS